MSSPAQYRNEAEWLEARRSAIGGSEAAAIVGLDPFRTALDVYREKTGTVNPRPDTPAMQRGRILEPVACELYTKLTGRKLRRQAMRRHPSYPFIACNLDRQILANGEERGTGLLEVKAPGLHVFTRMKREGLPAHYVVQMQHNLGVWDYEWGSYAILSAELWSLIWFDVKRDDAFVATLFEQEEKFWNSCVVPRVEPPPVTRVLAAPEGVELPPVEGQIVTRDDAEWTEAVETLGQARTLRETAETIEAQAETRVKELMGTHGVVEGANARIYWKPQPGRTTFDKKALASARPLDPIKVGATVTTWAEQLPDVQKATLNVGGLLMRLGDDRLDLAAFEKVGKNFETFRYYQLRPMGSEDEE